MPTSDKTKFDNGRARLNNKRKQLNNTALPIILFSFTLLRQPATELKFGGLKTQLNYVNIRQATEKLLPERDERRRQ